MRAAAVRSRREPNRRVADEIREAFEFFARPKLSRVGVDQGGGSEEAYEFVKQRMYFVSMIVKRLQPKHQDAIHRWLSELPYDHTALEDALDAADEKMIAIDPYRK